MRDFVIGTAIFNLGDLKTWIEECEKEFHCPASQIAVAPDAGGDWTGRGDEDDSIWELDGTVVLGAEKIK